MKEIDFSSINQTINWWERHRLSFNMILGALGTFSLLLIFSPCFGLLDCIGILFWGFMANVLYSLGILLEIINVYYLKSKFNFFQYRHLFIIFGTAAYGFVTFFYPFLYYMHPF
ncbi:MULTISPECIES: hypothetical protein [Flavobacterium]|uniref:Uncharacterized protein n=1 Tax=Flavobacterium jumunjinense TaxID=998845 RepID=A0ABV5GK15_9FLAO|nr:MULTISPECIES: hypothetical protein [Flavobacterium]